MRLLIGWIGIIVSIGDFALIERSGPDIHIGRLPWYGQEELATSRSFFGAYDLLRAGNKAVKEQRWGEAVAAYKALVDTPHLINELFPVLERRAVLASGVGYLAQTHGGLWPQRATRTGAGGLCLRTRTRSAASAGSGYRAGDGPAALSPHCAKRRCHVCAWCWIACSKRAQGPCGFFSRNCAVR